MPQPDKLPKIHEIQPTGLHSIREGYMDSYTAVVDGVSFDLTQREFEVLRELLLNQGRVLTRQNLLDKLWKV